MKLHIETPRYLLRDLEEYDAQGMFDLDSDAEVMRFLGNISVQSIEDSLQIVKNVRQQYLDHGIGRWAIEDKATGAFVGWCGLKYELLYGKNVWDAPPQLEGNPVLPNSTTRYYDLGYRILRDYWGQGTATETARAALGYGLEQMGLSEIFAAADVDNTASNQILRKLGFQRLGGFTYDGAPHHWYGIRK